MKIRNRIENRVAKIEKRDRKANECKKNVKCKMKWMKINENEWNEYWEYWEHCKKCSERKVCEKLVSLPCGFWRGDVGDV
jgi:hypothetical protein